MDPKELERREDFAYAMGVITAVVLIFATWLFFDFIGIGDKGFGLFLFALGSYGFRQAYKNVPKD